MTTRWPPDTKKNHKSTYLIMKRNIKSRRKNIEKHRQRWWSPNKRISSGGNVCPKNIGITTLGKKEHRHRIATKIWSSFKSNYDNHWSLNWSLNWWYKWWRSMVWSSCCDTLEILELIICSTKKQHFFCNSHILWKLIDTDLNWNNASV